MRLAWAGSRKEPDCGTDEHESRQNALRCLRGEQPRILQDLWYDGRVKLYRCRTCGFVSLFPDPGGDPLICEYDDFYSLEFTEQGPVQYPERQEIAQDIVRRIRASKPHGKLLDVGCGDGYFLSLCRPFYDCLGVDPSAALADYAERQAQVPVEKALYEADTFPAESFDVISIIQVLEHLPNPREILRAAYEDLRPGGLLVVEVPSIRAPHFLVYRFTGLKLAVENHRGIITCHFGYYEPRTLERVVVSCGFKKPRIVTGRWAAKHDGVMGAIGRVADPVLDRPRIGGILLFAEK
jgi:SAM-dependent methyltransferase